jgi:hypothetical protein
MKIEDLTSQKKNIKFAILILIKNYKKWMIAEVSTGLYSMKIGRFKKVHII